VPKSRKHRGGLAASAAGIAGTVAVRIWLRAARRPVDSFAVLAAMAASLIIVVNAVFLQSGSLPTPFFVNATPPHAVREMTPSPVELPRPRPTDAAIGVTRPPDRMAERSADPIAKLIGQTARIMAVQRALTDYGYGQIEPTGIIDPPTKAAIERFEREHNMPITGKVSDRLVNELAALIGHPLH
jgi:Putative peptidoglycan binding domain